MAHNNAAPLARLIEQFERLPGIGRKNAQRLAYHILSMTDEQAKEFAEVAKVNGIILTKLDGTAKGGIAVAIQSELDIPVKYIGVGESIDDLQKFDANSFVNALFDIEEETKC